MQLQYLPIGGAILQKKVRAVAHKGLNLPKRFTNLGILDSSNPQNEKGLPYRKQKKLFEI